jgi:hypothetical protein
MAVLGTKLHLPSPRRRLVARTRITDRLRVGAGEGARLVLIAAPAGFGKTTLLAQWLAADGSQCRVAWLALDPGDADLSQFLTHLVAAIQVAEPEAGVDALAMLEAGGPTPPETVLVSLINDLDVLAESTVVALDDYHVIDGPAVHDAMTFLLDNLPPQVTLAMTTRPILRCPCRVCVRVASSWRCGPRTSGSPPTKPRRFSTRSWVCTWSRRSWPRSRRAPRGRRRGCSWPRCRLVLMPLPPTRPETSLGSSRPSLEAIGSSLTISLRRF